MKAVICRHFGEPELLEMGDVPIPSAGAGQVLVRVRAAGVNYADLVVVAGKYQVKTEPPFVPGMEVAGDVAAVGPGVTGFGVGDRVVGLIDGGGFAEFVAAKATQLFPLPDDMSFETGAGTFVNYATAYGALHWRAGLKSGETCLVLGGAGGVGLASIAIASGAGARVIGAASSAERCEIMSAHGANDTIDYVATSLKDRVAELTGKRGADVIIDPVGGEMGGLATRCVAWSGRIVTLGFPAGSVPSYPANILLVKNAAALGFFFGSYLDHARERVRDAAETIHAGLLGGRIATYPITVEPLDGIGSLLKQIKDRRLTGKAVVVP